MVKKIFLYLLLIVIIGYLFYSITVLNKQTDKIICKDIELNIKDSIYSNSITKRQIEKLLKQQKVSPIGKSLNEISIRKIEKILNDYPLIDKAECYKTLSGKINIDVQQRYPLLRIMSGNRDFYLDNKGEEIPSNIHFIAHRIVVTGYLNKTFIKDKLYKLGLFLKDNSFWEANIEQINVLPGEEVELVPRIGNHIIYLGKIDNFEDKLNRLKKFYSDGLNKIGWNKYSKVNIEFNNQIICTKN